MLTGELADRRPWDRRQLADLLADYRLAGRQREPLVHDGWSGAELELIDRGDERFVLKRTSAARDWIVRATNDPDLREAWAGAIFGVGSRWLPESLVGSCLGVAADGDGAALLMPDLSAELIAWERPGHEPALDTVVLDRILRAVAGLHFGLAWRPPWLSSGPWCGWAERLLLLSPIAAARYRAEKNAVGDVFAAGWETFDRLASAPARRLVHDLAADPAPLIDALHTLPVTVLHGDLKLSNVALVGDGVGLIDWEMVMLAPVAVELGWLLVSNVALLREPPGAVLDIYRKHVMDLAHPLIGPEAEQDPSAPPTMDVLGDWQAQADLAIVVGLLLRGWRKGLDAEAGLVHPSGVSAADDLSWWCRRALEVAEERLR